MAIHDVTREFVRKNGGKSKVAVAFDDGTQFEMHLECAGLGKTVELMLSMSGTEFRHARLDREWFRERTFILGFRFATRRWSTDNDGFKLEVLEERLVDADAKNSLTRQLSDMRDARDLEPELLYASGECPRVGDVIESDRHASHRSAVVTSVSPLMRRLTSGVDGKPENCSRPLHPDQWMLIARAERHVEDAPAAPAPSLKTQHAAFHDELKALIQRLGFESTVALVTDWGYREPGERKLFAEFTCAAPVRQRRVVLWDHLHVAEEALTHLADWRNELGDAAMQRRAP